MAYLSSTTTSPNPPVVGFQSVAGPRTWIYQSTHAATDIALAGFFTDGRVLGIKRNDFLYHYPSSGSTLTATAHICINNGSSASGSTVFYWVSTTFEFSVASTVALAGQEA